MSIDMKGRLPRPTFLNRLLIDWNTTGAAASMEARHIARRLSTFLDTDAGYEIIRPGKAAKSARIQGEGNAR
jgi:hypothetical protein